MTDLVALAVAGLVGVVLSIVRVAWDHHEARTLARRRSVWLASFYGRDV